MDRKTGDERTLVIQDPAVSVVGGIQPAVLARVLAPEFFESGLAARVLLVMPPQVTKKWSEAEVSQKVRDLMAKTLRRLAQLRDGNRTTLKLTEEAKQVYTEFYNEHARAQEFQCAEVAAAYAKLEATAARFALIFQCIRAVSGHASPIQVDEVSMKAGIKLARWFREEIRRIYSTCFRSSQLTVRDHLIAWMKSHDAPLTPREVSRHNRRFESTAAAEEAMDELVRAGIGRWQHSTGGRRGGRPSRQFVFNDGKTPEGGA